MKRQSYPDDVTDQEWDLIKGWVTHQANPRGRGNTLSVRCLMRFFIYCDRDAAGGCYLMIFLPGNRSMLNLANGNGWVPL